MNHYFILFIQLFNKQVLSDQIPPSFINVVKQGDIQGLFDQETGLVKYFYTSNKTLENTEYELGDVLVYTKAMSVIDEYIFDLISECIDEDDCTELFEIDENYLYDISLNFNHNLKAGYAYVEGKVRKIAEDKDFSQCINGTKSNFLYYPQPAPGNSTQNLTDVKSNINTPSNYRYPIDFTNENSEFIHMTLPDYVEEYYFSLDNHLIVIPASVDVTISSEDYMANGRKIKAYTIQFMSGSILMKYKVRARYSYEKFYSFNISLNETVKLTNMVNDEATARHVKINDLVLDSVKDLNQKWITKKPTEILIHNNPVFIFDVDETVMIINKEPKGRNFLKIADLNTVVGFDKRAGDSTFTLLEHHFISAIIPEKINKENVFQLSSLQIKALPYDFFESDENKMLLSLLTFGQLYTMSEDVGSMQDLIDNCNYLNTAQVVYLVGINHLFKDHCIKHFVEIDKCLKKVYSPKAEVGTNQASKII